MSLFSRNDDLPGIHGALRDLTPGGRGLRRFNEGDIAVVDAPDLTRRTAEELIGLKPGAVLNIAPFATGGVPNLGPQLLIDAGVPMVGELGAGFREAMKDGRRTRVTEEGGVYSGEEELGAGTVLTAAAAERDYEEGKRALGDHLEAYFGNATAHAHAEAPLLIDGLGIPDPGVELRDHKVLVVSPTPDHRERIERLRPFLREYRPRIIAVEDAADTLVGMGYQPDLIVGDPAGINADTLRGGARVVLPADPDGHAEGLARIQDLGVGAVTFPSATKSATELALLLADYHGAELIVHAGEPFRLGGVFAERHSASPEALLTRMKLGGRLVDADAVDRLYQVTSHRGVAWLWALLGILVAVAVIVIVAGGSGAGTFTENLIDTWNNLALTVQGWFS